MTRTRFAVVAALLVVPVVAFAADLVGRPGTVVELQVFTTSGDTYLQHHGTASIDNGFGVDEYKWGGTSCSNKTLTSDQVTMLQRAFESGSIVTPFYKAGQGSNECLVGFSLTAP